MFLEFQAGFTDWGEKNLILIYSCSVHHVKIGLYLRTSCSENTPKNKKGGWKLLPSLKNFFWNLQKIPSAARSKLFCSFLEKSSKRREKKEKKRQAVE